MSTKQQSYKRFLQQSWLELEGEFRKGNVNPQHENDVVCYLYYALAKRFKKKGFPLYFIKTEDTCTVKEYQLRPDLNLNDRVYVEVKIFPLRKYNSGWKRRQLNIEYNVDKLKDMQLIKKRFRRFLKELQSLPCGLGRRKPLGVFRELLRHLFSLMTD